VTGGQQTSRAGARYHAPGRFDGRSLPEGVRNRQFEALRWTPSETTGYDASGPTDATATGCRGYLARDGWRWSRTSSRDLEEPGGEVSVGSPVCGSTCIMVIGSGGVLPIAGASIFSRRVAIWRHPADQAERASPVHTRLVRQWRGRRVHTM
jgi:hypothetical protein